MLNSLSVPIWRAFAICFFLFISPAFAQNGQIDSLKMVLLEAKEDTNKIITLNEISKEFLLSDNYDSCLSYALQAKGLTEKMLLNTSNEKVKSTSLKKQLARAYHGIGNAYYRKDNYPEALKNYFISLNIRKEIGDKQGITKSLNNIGNIYEVQGNYKGALQMYSASLKIRMEMGDKEGMVKSYNNIGIIYEDQGNYSDALKSHFAGLKMQQEIGDKQGIADSYNNIGNVYESQGNYPEALKNHFASLKMQEEIGNKEGMADSYNNIGILYQSNRNYSEALKNQLAGLKIRESINDKKGMASSYMNLALVYVNLGNLPEALKNDMASLKINQEIGNKPAIGRIYNNMGEIYYSHGNYSEALKNFEASLNIKEETGDKRGMALSYSNIGSIYLKEGKYTEAISNLNKGLKLSIAIGSKSEIKNNYFGLAEAYEKIKNYPQAYSSYKQFIIYRDSLFNEENTKKTVRAEMNYEFEKKEQVTKLANENERLLSETKSKNQRNIYGGIILALLSGGGLLIRQNKLKQKALLEENKRKGLEAELETHRNIQKERDRISRDLHDSVGSQLTYIISQLDYTSNLIPGTEIKALDKLQHIRTDSRELMQMLRETIWTIQKDKLSLKEFNDNIKELLAKFNSSFPNLNFQFETGELQNEEAILQPAQLLNLFRIIQEGINNAVKHSDAKNISVSILLNPAQKIVLKIKDDGKGIKEAEKSSGGFEHHGLKNMKLRAEEIGGIFAVNSKENKGVEIMVEFQI